jgi:hypothetical protein
MAEPHLEICKDCDNPMDNCRCEDWMAEDDASKPAASPVAAPESDALLADPNYVHIKILRGEIALTKAQAIHIAGLPADIEERLASPVAGVSAEMEKWLRSEAAEKRKSAESRRGYAAAGRNENAADRKAAHAITEQLLGRKIPKTTLAQDKEAAEIQDRIAAKLEREASMIEGFADSVAQPSAPVAKEGRQDGA